MTKERAIELLLTTVGEMTSEEVEEFRSNRAFLDEVSATPEYRTASREDWQRKMRTPGGVYTSYLDDHITHRSGQKKTVCTSAALAFFNISPKSYHYSGHAHQDNAVLRRHGWSVRSRKSKFKVKQGTTLGRIRKQLAKEGDLEGGHYKLSIRMAGGTYHCIVLGRHGDIVVDTASSKTTNRCKVRDIYIVTPND